MAKLNQIIAAEKTLKAAAETYITSAYHRLQKPALLAGLERRYLPRDDQGETLPGESSRVQVTVASVLDEVKNAMVELFDLTATKDTTNQAAVADIVLPDQTILARNVPVSTLLFLEKRLTDLATVVKTLPVLDQGEVWTRSLSDEHVWMTEPVKTVRSKKIPRNHVKAKATDKHPEQVEVYYEDVVVGDWSTTKFSGAFPATQVRAMQNRILVLQTAVKQAREAANLTEVVNVKIGEAILSYALFG